MTFRTRWFAGISETDKLVSDGVEYDVKGVLEIGRREGLEIAAEATL